MQNYEKRIKAAERGVYEAKKDGRNCIQADNLIRYFPDGGSSDGAQSG